MPLPWYDRDEHRPDSAWEWYHENSKRGPHDGMRAARAPLPAPDYAACPGVALPEPAPADGAGPKPGDPGAARFAALSSLLAAAFRPPRPDDAIGAFVAIASALSPSRGIAWYDPTGHMLRLVRRDDPWPLLRAALAEPRLLDRSDALILLVGDLDAATAAAGERGYRNALLAAGRRLAALEAAANATAIRLEPVAFHDRDMDALLHLDGLARSVLAAVAITSGG